MDATRSRAKATVSDATTYGTVCFIAGALFAACINNLWWVPTWVMYVSALPLALACFAFVKTGARILNGR